MTNEEKRKCKNIINTASLATAGVGAGLAQLPGTDNAAIVPIQVTMTIALANVFNIGLSESTAKAALATATATTLGRGISQFLVGWIPGFGNIFNASTAAGVTQLIGWSLAQDFSKRKMLK